MVFESFTDLALGGAAGAVGYCLFKHKADSASAKEMDADPNAAGEGIWLKSQAWMGRRKAKFVGRDSIGYRLQVEGLDGYRWIAPSTLHPASFEEFLKNPAEATWIMDVEDVGGKIVPTGVSGANGLQDEMQKVFSIIAKEQELTEMRDSEENKTIRAQAIQAEQANQIAKILPRASSSQMQSTR